MKHKYKNANTTNYYFKEMPNDYVEDQSACHEQFFLSLFGLLPYK